MTKLDHERWHLKLIDDARRQHATLICSNQSAATLNRIDWFGIELAATEEIAEQKKKLLLLEPHQQELAAYAFRTFANYRNVKPRSSQSKYQAAEWEVFICSADKLLDSLIADLKVDRIGFWQWYIGFHAGLPTKERHIFADFGFGLLRSRLPIWLARDFAAAPPSAIHLLRMMS